MVTYYAAQLGISLSVVDSKANYHARIQAENHFNSCKARVEAVGSQTNLSENLIEEKE